MVKPKPSPLIEALNGDLSYKPGPQCSVGVLLRTLPPEEVEALQSAIDRVTAGTATAAALCRALHANGHTKVNAYMLNHHRRGYCACGAR